jgi:FkbM family methyltransferase
MAYKHVYVDKYLFFDESLLSENKIFVEIGSFTGEHAKALASRYNCKMIIYEASKSNFALLDKNTEGHDIIIHNKAIGSENGSITFYEFLTSSSNSTYPRHKVERNKELKRSYSVEVVDLKSVLAENKIDHIDSIFFNCEGSELDILSSFFDNKKMHDKITQLSVSFHPQIYGERPIHEILKKAKLNGFSVTTNRKKFPCTLFYRRS